MKKDVAEIVAKCMTRQQVKAEHQAPADGQSERIIQTLEDMMRACTMEFKGNWDDHLPLMEFAYNNSFHSTIAGRSGIGARNGGKDTDSEEVSESSQDRQKSYAGKHRMEMEYGICDKVFLKVSPWKGILRFGKQEKLSLR
ncbi:UNVERIFIED_CONTAM: hypothetical protein Scaly_0584800 [Sesamum calycinum]|uniref:Reverse transcriptase domain-containing protein n=1 Tax=Sesamum calycinum TaxID=2727403 RepID=A0AAW2RS62_9LAMI